VSVRVFLKYGRYAIQLLFWVRVPDQITKKSALSSVGYIFSYIFGYTRTHATFFSPDEVGTRPSVTGFGCRPPRYGGYANHEVVMLLSIHFRHE
jgi:hypothetical protein